MESRIMYIEDKSTGLSGPERIGRVTYPKSSRAVCRRSQPKKDFAIQAVFNIGYNADAAQASIDGNFPALINCSTADSGLSASTLNAPSLGDAS